MKYEHDINNKKRILEIAERDYISGIMGKCK